ncbi:hypothetical protein RHSIM_Rhsim13G0159800 [Rhododendron simsii]|uniref:Gnk2-homologous domain-containing protein n=1 Tax=Rhododendron simsii TaxID=118357 RepID=A0A834FXY4_RHOSS|nr:hypothetical protein RHSIM_Rhsim13G0159800 [Rhododendron simsii]
MKVPKSLPRSSTMDNLPHKMPRKALFALPICFLSLIPIIEGADPNYLFMECPNATLSTTSTYAANSTYQKNLNTMLSGLSHNSNNASNGFYNFTAGSSPPDVAYGLFICRGDLSATTCRDCVTYAAGDVVERCPGSKRVTIWYDECILRYSNVSIFSVLDTSFRRTLRNPENATNATSFREALRKVIEETSNYQQKLEKMTLVMPVNPIQKTLVLWMKSVLDVVKLVIWLVLPQISQGSLGNLGPLPPLHLEKFVDDKVRTAVEAQIVAVEPMIVRLYVDDHLMCEIEGNYLSSATIIGHEDRSQNLPAPTLIA